jgi:hypothetical protein
MLRFKAFSSDMYTGDLETWRLLATGKKRRVFVPRWNTGGYAVQ